MDGLLVIDKPPGPTSHDVVARVRRALDERRVGHAGTLDPIASGVLLLLLGRATRLARFLSARDKSYDAVIRLGVATDTYDAAGLPIGPPHDGPPPSYDAIEQVLHAFRGTFLQTPPRYSAKKIGGRRSYKIARARIGVPAERPALPAPPAPPARLAPSPVLVTAHAIDIVGLDGDRVTIRVDCSAGFYLRSLAHDLGERLGIGAHLAELRRTRSGDATLDDTVSLHVVERSPDRAAAAIVPLRRMLPGLAPVVLTPEGARRATHGRDLGPGDTENADDAYLFESAAADLAHDCRSVRLLDGSGRLIGIGEPARIPGLLHPSVVLV